MLIQSYYNIEYILYDFLVSKTLFKSIFSDMQVGKSHTNCIAKADRQSIVERHRQRV